MTHAKAQFGEHGRHQWAVVLLLFALLLRGMVPAGWMPAMASDGPPFIICTAQGLVAAADAWQPNGEQTPPASTDNSLCAFAVSATPMLAAMPAVVVAIALAAREAAPPTGPPAPIDDPRVHLRPPAQAPPTLR